MDFLAIDYYDHRCLILEIRLGSVGFPHPAQIAKNQKVET